MAEKSLGDASVRIRAERDMLRADLEGAKQDVTQASAQMEAQAKRPGRALSDGFEKAGTQIKGATKGVREFVGSLTATIGIVTRLLGILGLVTAAIAGIVALATKWGTALEKVKVEAAETAEVLAKVNQARESALGASEQEAAIQKIHKEFAEDTAEATAKLAEAQEKVQKIEEKIAVRRAGAGLHDEGFNKLLKDSKDLNDAIDKLITQLNRAVVIRDNAIRKILDDFAADTAEQAAAERQKAAEEQYKADSKAVEEWSKMMDRNREALMEMQENGLKEQQRIAKEQAEAIKQANENIANKMNDLTNAIEQMIGVITGPFGKDVRRASEASSFSSVPFTRLPVRGAS